MHLHRATPGHRRASGSGTSDRRRSPALSIRHVTRLVPLALSALLTIAAPSAQAAEPATPSPEAAHARGLRAYQRGDLPGAMAALRAPAQAGHAPSQSLLGFIYERADLLAEALPLLQQAAGQGDAEAHAALAGLALTGRGLAKDEKQAWRHFSEAADRGHASSIEIVSEAWLRGQFGTDAAADPAAARRAVWRAAEAGHLPSARAWAQALREGGLGLPRDEAEAAAWQARVARWQAERAAAVLSSGARR